MKILVIDSRDIDRLTQEVKQALEGGPVQVDIKTSRKRSLSQNALSWVWYAEMSRWLKSKGEHYAYASPEWVHDAMCHTFNGYESIEMVDVVTRARSVTSKLKGTSCMDTGEMKHFLDLVFHWAAEKGLLLPIPEDSQYAELKKVEDGLD